MLETLVKRAWRAYEALDGVDYAVKPSCPILYFGDSEAYFDSSRKVITVGLNPSRLEFPEGGAFSRFPGSEAVLTDGLTQKSRASYVRALNAYFTTDPYDPWFGSFEPMLKGMACSYYPGAGLGTALHTDICSPVATNPTWSGLSAAAKADLEKEGADLWHDLVRWLRPDVILLSIRRSLLDRIRFPQVSEWNTVHVEDGAHRRRPYEVTAARYEVGKGHFALAVFGRAAQTPFGLISKEVQTVVGEKVGRMIDG